MIAAILVDGPAEEPMTPDQLKARARHDRSDEDALLPDYIRAARQQVELDTERALLTQSWRASIASGGVVALPWPPLQDITEVLQVIGGVSTVLEPAAYAVDYASGVMTLPVIDGGYLVEYVAGAESVALIPPLLLQAVGILAVHYLTLGRDLVSAGAFVPVPQNYLDAIQPFRPVSV